MYGWLQRGEQISSLSQAISIILNTSSYNNIFWFFLPLIAIYLSIPVFSRITDKYRIFSYMIWLGIIFVFSLPTFCRLTGITFNGALVPPVVSGYMVYPALGYVFNQTNFTKCHRIMIYLSGILGWALMFFGIIILSDESGTNTLFKGYLNFPAALQAIAVFVWVKYNLSSIPNKIKPLIHKISQATFGVYCMHELFILEIPRLFHINNSSILFRTIGAVLIFFLCIGLTFVLQKIPLVKNAVPK